MFKSPELYLFLDVPQRCVVLALYRVMGDSVAVPTGYHVTVGTACTVDCYANGFHRNSMDRLKAHARVHHLASGSYFRAFYVVSLLHYSGGTNRCPRARCAEKYRSHSKLYVTSTQTHVQPFEYGTRILTCQVRKADYAPEHRGWSTPYI